MITYIEKRQKTILYRTLCAFVAFTFAFSVILPPQAVAQVMPQTILNLPAPGVMVRSTPSYNPAVIKGIKVFPDNPLKFDFIIDKGDTNLEGEAFKEESAKLIKYFMASLTVPEEDLWVNLSPYEKDRIIPEKFGHTEMGRDLLAQDYLLKQLTASLMYPEDELGKNFWDRVYTKAYEKFGTTEIPMNTFNKVWIVPEKAVVYENGDVAFVVESRLKVMLEEDYLAMGNNNSDEIRKDEAVSLSVTTQIIREILIPEIEKEVNQGKNFAQLRQIYHSLILATWFKRNLKESLLGKIYVGQNKVEGVDVADKQVKQKIYNQYLAAFKTGIYNYIKEDYDPATQRIIPRKYFSGGLSIDPGKVYTETDRVDKVKASSAIVVSADLEAVNSSRLADNIPLLDDMSDNLEAQILLIQGLFNHNDWHVHEAAVSAWVPVVVARVKKGLMSIEEIQGLFNHNNWIVRRAALNAWSQVAVARVEQEEDVSIREIQGLFNDNSITVQKAAVNAWISVIVARMKKGEDVSLEEIQGLFNDNPSTFQQEAVNIWIQVAVERVNEGLMSIEEIQELFNDNHPVLQQAALGAWSQVAVEIVKQGGDVSLEGIQRLFNHKSFSVQQAAVEAWSQVAVKIVKQGGDVSIEEIKGLFNHDNWSMRSVAMEAWIPVVVARVKKGLMSIEEIQRLFNQDNMHMQQAAVKAWSQVAVEIVKQGGDVSLEEIKGLFNHDNWSMRSVAMEAWIPVAVAIVKKEGNVSLEGIQRLFNHNDSYVQRDAVNTWIPVAVEIVKQGGDVSLEEIQGLFNHDDWRVQEAAVEAWSQVVVARVKKGLMSIEEIQGLFNHDNERMQEAAVKAWGLLAVERVKKREYVSLEGIQRLFNDNTGRRVRQAAMEAWSQVAVEIVNQGGDVSLEGIQKLFNHKDSNVQRDAVNAWIPVAVEIVKQGGDVSLEGIQRLFNHNDGNVQQDAVNAWSQVVVARVKKGLMSIEEIQGLFNHNDSNVQKAAVEAWIPLAVEIVKQGGDVSLEEIQGLFNHNNWQLQKAAIHAWSQISVARVNQGKGVSTKEDREKASIWREHFNLTDRLNDWLLNIFFMMTMDQIKEFEVVYQDLMKEFISANNALDNGQQIDEDTVKNLTMLSLSLEFLIPGSIHHVISLVKNSNNGIQSAREFLEGKKGILVLVSKQYMKAFYEIMKKFDEGRLDQVQFYKMLDISTVFISSGAGNKLMRILENIPEKEQKRFDDLYHLIKQDAIKTARTQIDKEPPKYRYKFFAQLLEDISPDVKETVLLGALKSDYRYIRRGAAKEAGFFKSRPMIDALIEALDDIDSLVWENAFESLARIGDDQVIAKLNNILYGIPEEVLSYIFDDHGSIVTYATRVPYADTEFASGDFSFQEERWEKNPKIKFIQETITSIEERFHQKRKSHRIDVSQIRDEKLKEFFEFLKEHQLEKYVVVVGGGVRDAYTGKRLNDIDINIVVPLSEEDHRVLLPTVAQADERIHSYIKEKLKLLAQAIGIEKDKFLHPLKERGEIMWNGMEIQYTGPIILKDKEEKPIYLKRVIVGDNGWLYSSNTGAGLLKMAMDSKGNLYGDTGALDDFDKGIVRITGDGNNFDIGGILRILRLKHEYGLEILEDDYQFIKDTIEKYRKGELPLPEVIIKEVVERQVNKIMTKAKNKEKAYAELESLGISALLRDKLGIKIVASSSIGNEFSKEKEMFFKSVKDLKKNFPEVDNDPGVKLVIDWMENIKAIENDDKSIALEVSAIFSLWSGFFHDVLRDSYYDFQTTTWNDHVYRRLNIPDDKSKDFLDQVSKVREDLKEYFKIAVKAFQGNPEVLLDKITSAFRASGFLEILTYEDAYTYSVKIKFLDGREEPSETELLFGSMRWNKSVEGIDRPVVRADYEPEKNHVEIVLGELESKGGIDFNSNKLDLQTKGRGMNFNSTVNLEELENMNINGFTPVIFQIVPVTNLPLFLGLDEGEESFDANEDLSRDISFIDTYRDKYYVKENERFRGIT